MVGTKWLRPEKKFFKTKMKVTVPIQTPRQRNSQSHLTSISSVSSRQSLRNEPNPTSHQEVSHSSNPHSANIKQASNSMVSRGSSSRRAKNLPTIAMVVIHLIPTNVLQENLFKKLLPGINPPKHLLRKPTSLTST